MENANCKGLSLRDPSLLGLSGRRKTKTIHQSGCDPGVFRYTLAAEGFSQVLALG